MEERTRYRVSGTIFLVALAVICLPMLFDGAGVEPPSIPVMPEAREQTIDLTPYDEVVPDTDVVASVSELAAEVDAHGFATDTRTRFGEPVLAVPDESTTLWAVQAASFAEFDNATGLRTRLRDDGYEAFISTLRTDTNAATSTPSLLYRVAVGPLLARSDAQRIRDEIARHFELDAQIMEMQP